MHIFASLSLFKLWRCTHCFVTPNLAIIIQSFWCHLTTITQIKWQTDKVCNNRQNIDYRTTEKVTSWTLDCSFWARLKPPTSETSCYADLASASHKPKICALRRTRWCCREIKCRTSNQLETALNDNGSFWVTAKPSWFIQFGYTFGQLRL